MVEENVERKDGEESLSELPKPCDCFYLIGGTSTGGCVALYMYDHLKLLTHHTKFVHYRIIATLMSMANLASTYWNQGRWKEAVTLEVVVMEKTKQVLGDDHPVRWIAWLRSHRPLWCPFSHLTLTALSS